MRLPFDGERVRWRHRLPPSSRACADATVYASLAWDADTLELVGRVYEGDAEDCTAQRLVVARLVR